MDKKKSMIGGIMVLLVLATMPNLAQCEDIKFFYMVQGGSVQCFLQSIQQDHVGVFQVKAESTNMIMSVNDPKGRELAREMGMKKMKAQFDAE